VTRKETVNDSGHGEDRYDELALSDRRHRL
jgi:hypothetical protein